CRPTGATTHAKYRVYTPAPQAAAVFCQLLFQRFVALHKATEVDLPVPSWHIYEARVKSRGDLPHVHPIASCGTGTEASGARAGNCRRDGASVHRRPQDRRIEAPQAASEGRTRASAAGSWLQHPLKRAPSRIRVGSSLWVGPPALHRSGWLFLLRRRIGRAQVSRIQAYAEALPVVA